MADDAALCARVLTAAHEVLGGAEVAEHDDFFAIGGDSFLAVQLADRLERDLGCAVPLMQLFEATTLADLARRLAAASSSDAR